MKTSKTHPNTYSQPSSIRPNLNTQPESAQPDILANKNIHQLSPAQIIHLQRTLGNKRVIQLLRNPQTHIQRSPLTNELRNFAKDYAAIVDSLRTEGLKDGDDAKLTNLHTQAQEKGLDNAQPSMFRQLTELKNFATGESDKTLPNILKIFDPDERTGDDAFEAIAAATFAVNYAETNEKLQDGSNNLMYDPSGFKGDVNKSLKDEAEYEMSEEENVAEARINMVVNKIHAAYQQHRHSHDGTVTPFDKTLLVFMGPEWFFNWGNRPVSRSECEGIIAEFRALSLLYPEMLIVPGTILSGDPYRSGTFKKKFKGFLTNVTNTAPVLWNGNLLHTIDKRGNAGDFTSNVGNYQPGTGTPLFDLGDIRFAIDICVDHIGKRAQTYMENNPDEKAPDVHLVTGAGQQFTPNDSSTRDGGLGISTDGTGMGGHFVRNQVDGDGTRTGTHIDGQIMGNDNKNRYRNSQDTAWLKYHNAEPLVHVVNALDGEELNV